MQFSERVGEQTVRRLVGPTALSAGPLLREVGVPNATPSPWYQARQL